MDYFRSFSGFFALRLFSIDPFVFILVFIVEKKNKKGKKRRKQFLFLDPNVTYDPVSVESD